MFQGQDDLKGSFPKAVCDRWATIPVVKVAQAETVIDFPVELDSAWAPLQRHFGCTAESGNNTANVLYNFTPDGNRVFKINVGQSDEIVSSEEAFFRMFYDIEALVWNYDLVLHGVFLVTYYESRRVLSILTWLTRLWHLKRTERQTVCDASNNSNPSWTRSINFSTTAWLMPRYPESLAELLPRLSGLGCWPGYRWPPCQI